MIDDIDAISSGSSISDPLSKTCPMSEECIKKVEHAKDENINVVEDTDIEKNVRSSFGSGDVENILSGESLYKTFTFQQTSDEDVEKCIAFWKTVMQKNLEPIKCSIIESSEPKMESIIIEEEEEHVEEDIEEKIKDAQIKIHGYYKNMWMTVLEEIKKRKLDEIKLYAKRRCEMCESQIPVLEISSSQEDITDLNDWQPKSVKLRKKDVIRKPRKIITPTCICEPAEPENIVSVETIVSDRAFVPMDTNRYKLRDLIREKRSLKVYSKWRRNALEPCPCGADICDCNLNPAIQFIQPPCDCGKLDCDCKLIPMIEDSIVGEEICICGSEVCICKQFDFDFKTAMPTESQSTLSPSEIHAVSAGKTETISDSESRDTLDETMRRETMYKPERGTLIKDKTVDITKEGSNKGSCETLAGIDPKATECVCEEECICPKPEIEKQTKQKKQKSPKRDKAKKGDKQKPKKKSTKHAKKSSKQHK